MKNMDGHRLTEHPEELLLAYVEGIVSDDDRSRVEKHIESCSDCRSEVLELEKAISALKKHKDVLCPELWELFDFLQDHKDPGGKVADHLTKCPLCREELERLKQGCDALAAPEPIRKVFREQREQEFEPETAEPNASIFTRLRELIAPVLARPMLAIGSAVAVALLVFFFYPGRQVQPIIALSSINWQSRDASGAKLMSKSLQLMGPSMSTAVPKRPRPRVAVLLIFLGFGRPYPQESIDSLYCSLSPSPEIGKRVELITPSQVKEVLSTLAARSTDPELLANNLFEKLNLSGVLYLRITAGSAGYRIDGDVADAATRTSVGKRQTSVPTRNDLPGALRDLAFALLKQSYL
jgi:predicted anti-sigma-YlaC factor YlaD